MTQTFRNLLDIVKFCDHFKISEHVYYSLFRYREVNLQLLMLSLLLQISMVTELHPLPYQPSLRKHKKSCRLQMNCMISLLI